MKTDVCLECYLDFQLDVFHFDCTGEYVCSAEEFAELVGQLMFVRHTQMPCIAEHGIFEVCPECEAVV